MAAGSNIIATTSSEQKFVITRVFEAPRELVWKAFTEPARLDRWWGPEGFSTRVRSLDLRPGGEFRYSQQTPDGKEMWGKWVYREVVPPERLVSVVSFTDAEGNPVRNPFSPGWPLEMLSTATFTEERGKTTLTLEASAYRADDLARKTFADGRGSMEQGFRGTLDRLDAYLATAR
jgi:uncharacterized protein YndB with AHSA1/START domain